RVDHRVYEQREQARTGDQTRALHGAPPARRVLAVRGTRRCLACVAHGACLFASPPARRVLVVRGTRRCLACVAHVVSSRKRVPNRPCGRTSSTPMITT